MFRPTVAAAPSGRLLVWINGPAPTVRSDTRLSQRGRCAFAPRPPPRRSRQVPGCCCGRVPSGRRWQDSRRARAGAAKVRPWRIGRTREQCVELFPGGRAIAFEARGFDFHRGFLSERLDHRRLIALSSCIVRFGGGTHAACHRDHLPVHGKGTARYIILGEAPLMRSSRASRAARSRPRMASKSASAASRRRFCFPKVGKLVSP